MDSFEVCVLYKFMKLIIEHIVYYDGESFTVHCVFIIVYATSAETLSISTESPARRNWN